MLQTVGSLQVRVDDDGQEMNLIMLTPDGEPIVVVTLSQETAVVLIKQLTEAMEYVRDGKFPQGVLN